MQRSPDKKQIGCKPKLRWQFRRDTITFCWLNANFFTELRLEDE
ncbi:MAG: hypothetical protein ACN6OD_07465 [Alcaligenes sp.]